MSDLEHARLMLKIALKNLKAIKGMKDAEVFDDEPFGFHAQQAIEKALKAWLSLIGVKYPRAHDMEELFVLLETHQAIVPEHLHTLMDLTDFAVQFRDEAFEEFGTELDREEIIQQVTELVEHVEKRIKDAEAKG
jgi:HEPN domain-containing protein